MDSEILALAEPIIVEIPEEEARQTIDENGVPVRQPPKRFCILKFGKVPYTKGGEDGDFVFNPESAKRIVEEFKKRGKDLVVDYDHSTVSDGSSHSGNAPAAGWISDLEISPDGLYAIVKNWTPKGGERLTNGEYRYMSPVIQFDKGKLPTALHSVALTNHPALHNTEALVAANDSIQLKDKYKATIKQILDGKAKMEEMLVKTVQSFSDHVAGNEADEIEMKAFMDELLKTETFADDTLISSHLQSIAQKKGIMQVPPLDQLTAGSKPNVELYLKWLAESRDGQTEDNIRRLYQAEYDMYANKMGNLPADVQSTKPQAPYQPPPLATPEAVQVIQPAQPTPIAPMNDTFTDSKVQDFLKLHDCKSLEDVTKKFIELDGKRASEIKSLNDKVATFKAEELVRKAMEEGKVTEAMRSVAVSMAKKDPESFNSWISASPKIVGSFTDDTQSESKDPVSVKATDAVKASVAKAMGVEYSVFDK